MTKKGYQQRMKASVEYETPKSMQPMQPDCPKCDGYNELCIKYVPQYNNQISPCRTHWNKPGQLEVIING